MSRLILGLIVGALGWSAASCAREPTDLLADDKAVAPESGEDDDTGDETDEDRAEDDDSPRKPDASVSDARVADARTDAGSDDAPAEVDEPPKDEPDAGRVALEPAPPDAGGALTPAPTPTAAPAPAPAAAPEPASERATDAGRRFPGVTNSTSGEVDLPEGFGRRSSADGGAQPPNPFDSFADRIREGIARFGRRDDD